MIFRCVRYLRHVLIYHKKMPLILFGGMKMRMRTLLRYASLYPKTMQAHVVRLELKHLWLPPSFDDVREHCGTAEKIHVHCLSGGVLQYTRFLRQHPDLRDRITSEIFDNPAHAHGFANFIHEHTMVPYRACSTIVQGIIPEPVAQSEYFLSGPLATRARRTVILSSKDRMCDAKYIREMIKRWSIREVWENHCEHLKSLRTFPFTYQWVVRQQVSPNGKKYM